MVLVAFLGHQNVHIINSNIIFFNPLQGVNKGHLGIQNIRFIGRLQGKINYNQRHSTRISAVILVSGGSLFPVSCHPSRHSVSYIYFSIWYWLNGSTIITIKYLAVTCSEDNFTFHFCLHSCLSIAYPVGKLYLTDDTRLILILKL